MTPSQTGWGWHDGNGVQAASEQLEARTLLTETIDLSTVVAVAKEQGTVSAVFRVSRSGEIDPITNLPDYSNSVVVSYNFSGPGGYGSATYGTDYSYSLGVAGQLTIPAGQQYLDVSVIPVNDNLEEPREIFSFTAIADVPNGGAYTNYGEIEDNDGSLLPAVSVVVTDHAAETVPTAAADKGMYTFTLTGNTAADLTVSFTMSGSASQNQDYITLPSSVVIPAGMTTHTLELTPIDDSLIEGTENAVLTITPNGSAYTVTGSPASMNIIDNDPVLTLPTVSIAVDPARPESTEPATNVPATVAQTGRFKLTRTAPWTSTLTVQLSPTLIQDTADLGFDYSPAIPTSKTFAVDQGELFIDVVPLYDGLPEGTEYVRRKLVTSSNYIVSAAQNEAVVPIKNTTLSLLPPIFDYPPTPQVNDPATSQDESIVEVTVCQNDSHTFQTQAHDQDSVGPATITYSGGNAAYSVDAGNGLVTFPATTPSGLYTVTVTAKDNELVTVSTSFKVDLIREPIPGTTTPELDSSNPGPVIELAEGATSENVIIRWDAATNADDYEIELWRFDGGAANGGWVSVYSEIRTVRNKVYALGEGLYSFFVRARNCGGMQKSAWKGVMFSVVNHGDLDASEFDQHNNFEDSCDCHPKPPGEDADRVRVLAGTGDALISMSDFFPSAAGPLSSFLLPNYASGGTAQPTASATNSFPAAPTSVEADLEVYSQSSTTSLVGRTAVNPIVNADLTRKEGSASFRIDPAGLVNAVGDPVPALASGNYLLRMNLKATMPAINIGSGANARTLPGVAMTFRTASTSLNYQRPSERSFAENLSVPGLNNIRFDANGASLYRGDGTSVRFSGPGWSTPAGSFTTMTAFTQSVPNPIDPQNPALNVMSAYKLTSVNGMQQLYSASGLLLETCLPDGDLIRFAYQDKKGDGTADDLVRVQSVNTNQFIDYGYVAGKISTATDWVGRVWSYVLNSTTGLLTEITGPAPSAGVPAPKVVLTWHGSTSQLASYTLTDTSSSFTERTEIDWDAKGNVSQIRRVDTQGTAAAPAVDRVWNFESAESREIDQIKVVDDTADLTSSGVAAPIEYDQITFPDGSISRRQLDAFGNTLREVRTVAGYLGSTVMTSVFERNEDGQITKAGPFEQKVGTTATTVPAITYEYDSLGRKTLATYPDFVPGSTTVHTTEAWTYVGNARADNPETYKNRVGNYTVFQYNADGFPTQIDEYGSLGGQLIATTFNTYLNGRLKTSATPNPNGLGGSLMGTEYYYDANKNLTHARVTTATTAGVLASPTVGDLWVSFGYDALQNLDWQTTQYRPTALVATGSPSVLLPSPTDVNLLTYKTDVATDAYGRVLTSTSPVPSSGEAQLITTMTYDAVGRPVTYVEPGSTAAATRTITYSYNSFGELKTTTLPDPDGGGALGVPSTVTIYDQNGNLKETQLLDGATIVSRKFYRIDSLGRLRFESVDMPGTATAVQTNAATYYQYDAVGRATVIQSPVGKAGQNENKYLNTTFAYNDVTNTVTTNVVSNGGDGIVLTVAPLVEKFDASGRLISSSQGGLTRTMLYQDDSNWTGTGTAVKITDERGKIWWEKYGPTGQLRRTWTPDPDGTGTSLAVLQTTYVYDVRGNLDTVTENSGALTRTTDYSYNPLDLLESVTTPVPSSGLPGLVTSWTYDTLNRVQTETGPSGAKLTYDYGNDGLLQRIDRDDNNPATTDTWFVQYAYDNLNRVQHVTTPDGFASTFYNNLGKVSRSLAPDPDGTGPLPRPSTIYRYSTGLSGQPLVETEDTNGSKTRYTFDYAGRMTEQFRPVHLNPVYSAGVSDFSTVYSNGSASTTPTEQWAYDAIGQLRTFTDALGNKELYTYDNLMRLTEIQGQRATANPAEDNIRKQSYEYSTTNGDLLSSTDPLGRKTKYTGYDGLGRVTETTRMLGSADHDKTTIEYDGFGRVKSTTALADVVAKAMTTGYQYDLLDRMIGMTDAQGGQTDYTFDSRGFLEKIDNPRDITTYLHYDNLGRLDASWLQGFSQTTGTRYTFDAMDRVSTVTDPLNNVTGYQYDSLGRMKQQTDPVQAGGTPVTNYTYDADGNLASITDPANNVTTYKFDHRNRLRQDIITLNGSEVDREYWYDNADNQTWAVDRNDQWRRFDYDFAFGAPGNYRQISEGWWSAAAGNTSKFTYSYSPTQGNGLLMTEVSEQANYPASSTVANRVSFQYDALARVISTTDWLQADTKTDAFELKYSYGDKVDRRTGTEARFAKFNSSGAETNNYWDFRNTYTWDTLNRVDDMKQESPANVTATTWSAKIQSTKAVDLGYFADGAIQTISRTQGADAYESLPLLTTYDAVANGLKHEGKLVSITHSGFATNGESPGNRVYSYEYDDQGRIEYMTTPAGQRKYGYDSFDQVTSATLTSLPAESYSYDTNGNRTVGAGSTATVIGAYNRITDDGTYTYLYDKEGNRTQRTLKAAVDEFEVYVYDYRQRLLSVTKNSDGLERQTVSYEYDGLDRRIRRIVTDFTYPGAVKTSTETVKQRFLYDTNVVDPSFDEVVIVLDEKLNVANPTLQEQHVFLNGPEIDQVFADQNSATSILWYLSDHQNTVRDVATMTYGATNNTANANMPTVRNHLEYDSFGNVTKLDNPSTSAANDGDAPGLEGTGNDFSPQRSYTGREPDAATGLIYYRARWFDPQLGRFISEDPIGFAAGDANLSRYVGNSTPNVVDPSGLYGQSERERAERQKRLEKSIIDNVKNGKVSSIGDRRNGDFWYEVDGVFVTDTPVAAIKDIWETKGSRIYCKRYSELILYKAVIDVAEMDNSKNGDEVLALMNNVLRGRSFPDSLVYDRLTPDDRNGNGESDDEFSEFELRPGDQIWIKNPYYRDPKTRKEEIAFSGEEGSNVIYKGNGIVISIYTRKELSLDEYKAGMCRWNTAKGQNAVSSDFKVMRIRRIVTPEEIVRRLRRAEERLKK